MVSLSLEGRVALVTGANRGIGAAIAERLAEAGATLVVHGREADSALAKASELGDRFGRPMQAVSGDLRDPQAIVAIFRAVFAVQRRLDVLVNNAGILRDGLLGMVSVDVARETLEVNTLAPLMATQEAVRLMRRHRSGSIVNITSIIGRVGKAGLTAYASSKAAVIGMTLASSKELAPVNIRVNAIAPGFIDTDMTRDVPPETHSEYLASLKMGRIGTPLDVANAVLFLASDLSGYVTGQVLGVDGGMLV